MTGFSRLAFVEGKLFLREHSALLGVFGLPVALVIGFGLTWCLWTCACRCWTESARSSSSRSEG
jgi:hypothetical protein